VTGRELVIDTAPVFEPLVTPSRYKGAFGGRGSGKSHFFAGLMIEDCLLNKGTRAVCIREVQKDLKDSAYLIIKDKLAKHGLGEADGFRVYEDLIKTPGDGLIIFKGMKDYTADSIKSLEGFTRAWVEEAQTLSLTSLNMLRPTIREEGSELWFSWNPRRKTDPVDVMLRGTELPTGAVVQRANWIDNPWFPGVLEQERQDCLRVSPEQYDHIWEGGYATVLEGAYYAKALADAKREGRIGRVAADPVMTMRLVCDIGGTGKKSDAFAIWAEQWIGKEIRVLNYYEAVGQPIGHHLHWMRENKYTPGNSRIILPHDGDNAEKVYDVTYRKAFEDAGYEVDVIPNQGTGAAKMRIEATRRMFPRIWFNEATTEAGRDALGWYHEKKDEERNVGLGPEHDWSSHGADAFGLGCIAYEEPQSTHPMPQIDWEFA
jgi:phage terminase large subunit